MLFTGLLLEAHLSWDAACSGMGSPTFIINKNKCPRNMPTGQSDQCSPSVQLPSDNSEKCQVTAEANQATPPGSFMLLQMEFPFKG